MSLEDNKTSMHASVIVSNVDKEDEASYLRKQIAGFKNAINIVSMTVYFKKEKIAYRNRYAYNILDRYITDIAELESDISRYKLNIQKYEKELAELEYTPELEYTA